MMACLRQFKSLGLILTRPNISRLKVIHTRRLSQQQTSDPQAGVTVSTGQLVEQQPIDDDVDIRLIHRENETYIEAVAVDPTKGANLIKSESKACVLCRLNLHNLNYTDVKIISQFMKRNGDLATYHESRLCTKQYLRVKKLVKQAQRCNLIKRPANYLVPGPWHNLNTYLETDRYRDQPMRVIKKQYWKM